MAIEITNELQEAFLHAKYDADRKGRGGTAYVDGLEAAAVLIARDTLRAVMHAFGEGVNPSYVVAHVAGELGVEL
jgi:hypothetical protein